MKREEAIKYIRYCMCEGRLVGNTKPIIDEKWQAGVLAIQALEHEPCEDFVSRQAVLSKKIYTETEEGWSGYTVDADYIEHLPSVKPQESKWIPVSERLPETDGDVLVYDGVDMFVAWYSLKGMWQGWNSSDNNFERDTPIIAWMPLPEPYKTESEDS